LLVPNELPDEAEAAIRAAMAMLGQKKLPLDHEAIVRDAAAWLMVKKLGSLSEADAREAIKQAIQAMADRGVLDRLQLGEPLKLRS
jgi:hypothetical protein